MLCDHQTLFIKTKVNKQNLTKNHISLRQLASQHHSSQVNRQKFECKAVSSDWQPLKNPTCTGVYWSHPWLFTPHPISSLSSLFSQFFTSSLLLSTSSSFQLKNNFTRTSSMKTTNCPCKSKREFPFQSALSYSSQSTALSSLKSEKSHSLILSILVKPFTIPMSSPYCSSSTLCSKNGSGASFSRKPCNRNTRKTGSSTFHTSFFISCSFTSIWEYGEPCPLSP